MFFRKFTVAKAQALHLVGWCANTQRGTVVGECQGKPQALEEMKVGKAAAVCNAGNAGIVASSDCLAGRGIVLLVAAERVLQLFCPAACRACRGRGSLVKVVCLSADSECLSVAQGLDSEQHFDAAAIAQRTILPVLCWLCCAGVVMHSGQSTLSYRAL